MSRRVERIGDILILRNVDNKALSHRTRIHTMPLFDSQKIHLKFYIRKSKTWKAKTQIPLETPVSKSEFCGFWIPFHNAKVMKQVSTQTNHPFCPTKTVTSRQSLSTRFRKAAVFTQAALSWFSFKR